MHSRSSITAVVLIVLSVASASGAAGAEPRRTEATSQVFQDSRTGVIFSAGMRADGTAVVALRVEDLFAEKLVTSDGTTDLKLTLGNDSVRIASSAQGIRISRKGRDAAVPARRVDPHDLDKVRGLLLGSAAVRAFRQFVADLEAREGDDDLMVLSTLADGLIVGTLDGDVGVGGRILRRLVRPSPQLRRANYGAAGGQTFPNCFQLYVNTLNDIWANYWNCVKDVNTNVSWYQRYYASYACDFELHVRIQALTWQTIACTAIPTR